MRPAGFFLLTLVVLVVWRWPYLSRPPYEDLAWLWQEANFLAENDFDYHKLWTEEPRADQVVGGGRSYLISIMPTLLATLMKTCRTNDEVFLVYHLVYLACGSAVATMLFNILRPRAGDFGAAMISMAALTTPAFSVRLEQIGMDLPMATVAIASGVLMWRKRYIWAAASSLLAFLIKPTGAIMTAANLAFLAVAVFSANVVAREVRRVRWRGLAAHAGVLLLEVGLVLGSGMMQIDQRWSPRAEVSVPRLWSAPYWVPDVMILFAVAVIASLVGAAIVFGFARRTGQTLSLARQFERIVSHHGVLLLSWLVVLGSLAAMTKVLFMPRYLTLPLPFLYLIVGTLVFSSIRWRAAGTALFGLVVALNLTNSHGAFYPSLVEVHGPEFQRTNLFSPRASIALERSLEYRKDHQATIDVMRLLETRFHDRPIFTDDTYYVYLTMPRLGYVHRPLQAYQISDYATAVERFLELTSPKSRTRPIFVIGGLSGFTVGGPEEGDEILYNDHQPIPLVAFCKVWPNRTPGEEAREKWYFEHLCPGGRLRQPASAISVAKARLARGDVERARRSLTMALEKFSNHRGLLLTAADAAIRAGKTEEAEKLCDRALRLDRGDLRALGLLATLWALRPADPTAAATPRHIEPEAGDPADIRRLLRAGRLEETVCACRAGLRLDAANPQLLFLLTAAELRRTDAHEAQRRLQQLVEILPHQQQANLLLAALAARRGKAVAAMDCLTRASCDGPEGYRLRLMRGLVRWQQGLLVEARRDFSQSLVLDNQSSDAHYFLGIIRLQQGQFAEAEAELAESCRLAPEFSDATNALGVVWARTGHPGLARRCFLDAMRYDSSHETARQNLAALQRQFHLLAERY